MLIEIKFPPVIDASLCAEFLRCEHKAQRKYVQGLRPNVESTDLSAGRAFAKAIETVRKVGNVQAGLNVLALELAAYVPREGSGKTLERMQEALELYFTTWPLAHDTVAQFAAQPMVEWTFQVKLAARHPETGAPLSYAGAMDRVLLAQPSEFDEDSGAWWVPGDDKTASSFSFGWAESWDMSFQMMGYMWALSKLGMRSQEARVRGVAIPSGRKLKSGGFSEPGALETKEVVVRGPAWRLEMWEQDMLGVVERMLTAWASGRWTRAWGNACNEYRGCEFKQVCMSPPGVQERMLEQAFKVERWSPLDRNVQKEG